MKVNLLVSEWCVPCRSAEAVWLEVAREKAFAFEVLDVGQPEGRTVIAKLGVRTVPATLIDGVLKHVGVPGLQEARALVAEAPDKAADSQHFVGLSMTPESRWAVACAMAWLAVAGAALVFAGGIVGDAPWRGAVLHAFGLGFTACLVFGLGEHMLPRFIGAPIRGGIAAWSQLALANLGTLVLAVGLVIDARVVALAGGAMAWSAFALFTVRIVPVLASSARSGEGAGLP